MKAILIQHAAQGYHTDPRLVARAFDIADPFPLPKDFLESVGWGRSDGDRAEHNAYLVARWVAELKAEGLSDNAVLDAMTAAAAVAWKAPLYFRVWKKCKALLRLS